MRVYRPIRYKIPALQVLPVPGWPRGLNTLVNPNRIRTDELTEAINIAYTQYGVLKKRAGTSLVTTLPAAVQGFGVLNKREDSGAYTKHFLAVAGGILYEIDPVAGSYSAISGHTFHSTNRVVIKQGMNAVYFFDGENPIVKWDGIAFTTFTPISAPTSPGLSKTGTGTGSTTWSYIVTASNGVGETIGSSVVNQAGMPATLDADTYLTFSWTAAAAATIYNVYRSKTGGPNATYLGSTSQTSFVDSGQLDDQQSVTILVPEENSTGGPIFITGTIYRDSIFGIDKNDRAKLWYSGGGDKIDSFSPGDGGSWYSYHAQEGEGINAVEAFAGLGTDYLYIFKDHKIGQFAFGTLGQPQVKDVNLAVGAASDASVVLFENDMGFLSRYGFYTLRMEPNLVNVLRIAELSIRVHPTYVSPITQSALEKVAGVYDKTNHVIVWSIPSGGAENNTSIAYDPVYLAFSEYQGIKATTFTRFVDNNNNEFSYGGDTEGRVFRLFDGTTDMGSAITFRASTKSFDMDAPWSYKYITRVFFIFGNISSPNLQVNLIQDGFRLLKEFSVNSDQGVTGWGVDLWGSILWGTSSGTPVNINTRLVQRYVDIERDLFSLQSTFADSSATSNFEILGMYILYRASSTPPPSKQRIP